MKRIAMCVAAAVAAMPLYGKAQIQAPGSASSGQTAPGTQGTGPGGPLVGTEITPSITAGTSYAQYLVDTMRALHPELVSIDVHMLRPGARQGVIAGSTVRDRLGRASDADDIAVAVSGEPRVEINRRGDQNVEVELALFDIYREVIGAVELTFAYPPGTDQDALIRKAAQYRDDMSRRILDAQSLADATQVDPRIPTRSYAQFLVDDTLARHPEIEVFTIHANTPGAKDYPIIASNIGRFGKAGDPTDPEVIATGTPRGAADARGARYEEKLPLKDASGATVGVAVVIFPYGPTSNRATVDAQAQRIVSDLQPRIANAEALVQPYPAERPTASANPIAEYNKQELGNKQDLPMTKETVSGQALSNSQEGYTEAVKNQAGLAPTNSAGSANDAFSVRGIKLNLFANYRLDGGVPLAGVITTPTEDKERIETLKGANALMFGVASPAGIINFVTKRAGPRDVLSVSAAGNSFGQYYGSIDAGRRFGPQKEVGVRVNASAAHLENGVHDLGGRGGFASIGVDYHPMEHLSAQFDYEYYDKHVPEQAGISLLSAINGVVPITRVPDPRKNLIDGWNVYSPRTQNVQGRVDVDITDNWKALVQVGQSSSHRHRNTVRIGGYDINTGAGGIVSVQPVTQDYQNNFGRVELLGHVRTWVLTHDVTFGYSHTERRAATYDVQNLTLTQRQNIYDPTPLPDLVLTKPGTANPVQNSKDTGLYVYDAFSPTFLPKLKVLAGLRRVQDDEINGTTFSRSYRNSPGYGVLYDILPTTTLFASYLEGLEAGGTSPANAANPNVILPPAVSRQKELGIRDSFFRGLSISSSYFEITRANAVTDPVTNIFAYSGDLEYKGVETTVSYSFLRDWTVNLAALWLKSVQNSPVQPLINGRVPENTPKWNGNVGVTYRAPWLPGLTLRAGAKMIAKRPVNPQDQNYIPGYTLYDAGLNYATRIGGKRVVFQLSGDNLGNKRYWNSVQTGTYGIGMDRVIRFSTKVDF